MKILFIFMNDLQIMFSELDLPITVEEILNAVSQLSNGKSSGSDRLLNEFFINGKAILTPYFHILFNKIFVRLFS